MVPSSAERTFLDLPPTVVVPVDAGHDPSTRLLTAYDGKSTLPDAWPIVSETFEVG
jgi:hypothetical protein